MKWKNKWVYCLNLLLMTLFLALALPCSLQSQEAFPSQTPSQGIFPSQTPSQKSPRTIYDTESPLRAGGGTGTGDPTEPGGGTENPGHQNDTDVPATDALPLVALLAVGYGIYRRKSEKMNNEK